MEDMKERGKWIDQSKEAIRCRKMSLLILDSPIPDINFSKVLIDGNTYGTEIDYDLKNSIGILGKGEFENKEIQFI